MQGPEPTPEDYAWRDSVRSQATGEYSQTGLPGYVEAFATLSPPRINCSQQQLLGAANASMINTFGWPIGIMDLGASRPKPMNNGIKNSVARGNAAYDFWSLRQDGLFYLLQSFFEDDRRRGCLFFNTRIIRTAEMLMYLSRLYRNLNIPIDASLYFKLRHFGLSERFMSASGNRVMLRSYGPSTDNEIETSVTTAISAIEDSLAQLVKELLTPVFAMFDFFEIDQGTYAEIVGAFQRGRLT